MLLDIGWWCRFFPEYNGVSLMWMNQVCKPDQLAASDACLQAMGARCRNKCIHKQFPTHIVANKDVRIHHLELIAVVVSLKHWAKELSGNRFVMLCDNQAVVQVAQGQATKDRIMQKWLRELSMVAAVNQFEVVLQFMPGVENRVPDVLSRLGLHAKYRKQWEQIKQPEWQMEIVEDSLFYLDEIW